MLVVLIVNALVSIALWIAVVKLLSCRPRIVTTTATIDEATAVCERLQFVPLGLAEQQLQVLKLRQIYQQQSVRLDRWQQLIQLMVWLKMFMPD